MPNVAETCNTPTSESPFWLITFGFLSTLALRIFVSASGVGLHEYLIHWVYVKTGFEISWSSVCFCCCKDKKNKDPSKLKIPKKNKYPSFVQVSLEFEARKCHELLLLSGYYANINSKKASAYVITYYVLSISHAYKLIIAHKMTTYTLLQIKHKLN